MKQETIAKEIGYYILRKYKVPYRNHQGSLVKAPKNHSFIRLCKPSSLKQFNQFYNITVDPKYKKLAKAMNAREKSNNNLL